MAKVSQCLVVGLGRERESERERERESGEHPKYPQKHQLIPNSFGEPSHFVDVMRALVKTPFYLGLVGMVRDPLARELGQP